MKRVVITGIGVVAANGIGKDAFHLSQSKGISGIRKIEEFERLKFSCQVGGIPEINDDILRKYFSDLELRMIDSSGIRYGVIAGLEAWEDAGLEIDKESVDYDHGIIFGAGISGVNKFRDAIYKVDDYNVRRLGSTVVINTMTSGVSAFLSGKIGAGNQVTTNSSACVTGTESITMAYDRIRLGQAKRILAGSCSEDGPYIWGGFDAMRVMNYKSNDFPELASRPMSESAGGFIPGSGAGAVVVESLDSALERNAMIYAEIIGQHINSGGHRNGGTMTSPNGQAVQQCIKEALKFASLDSSEIDYINGHLTATSKDSFEIQNWKTALDLDDNQFPLINSTKSTLGHCLSAAGSIEIVATLLQMKNACVYPSINCEDVHPEILELIPMTSIPHKLIQKEIDIAIKASFGFGDVNGCVIFRRWI